jgi:hypothetical protein
VKRLLFKPPSPPMLEFYHQLFLKYCFNGFQENSFQPVLPQKANIKKQTEQAILAYSKLFDKLAL